MAKHPQPVWDETRHTYVMPDGRTLGEAAQGGGPAATPTAPAAAQPRKRRRVFMWFFLAVQALFLIWLITGLASHSGPTTAQVAQFCGNGQWQGVFTSYHDCVVHGANGLRAAADIGTGIGAALIIGLWVAVDVILGIGRLVVVSARRR